jgi:hypothetical protein
MPMLAHHVGVAVDPLAWRGALGQAHMALNPDPAEMDFSVCHDLKLGNLANIRI